MTIDQFMAKNEKYYGKYPDKMSFIKSAIALYLQNFREDKLSHLLQIVWMNHNHNFGAPDIAAIEKAYDYALKNGKCGDLKKMREATIFNDDEVLTEEEKAETQRMIEDAGYSSLFDMLNSQINEQRKKRSDQDKES